MSFLTIDRKDSIFKKIYTVNSIMCTVDYIVGIGVVNIHLQSQDKNIVLRAEKYKLIPIISFLFGPAFKITTFGFEKDDIGFVSMLDKINVDFSSGIKYVSNLNKNSIAVKKNDKLIANAYKQTFVTATNKKYDLDVFDSLEIEMIIIMIVLIDLYMCETGKQKLLLGEEITF